MKTKLGILAFFLFFAATVGYSQSFNNYYLPQVANGTYVDGSYRTSFVLFNNHGTAATVVLTLTNDAGSGMSVTIPGLGTGSEFTFLLAPGAIRIYQTDGTGPLTTGAATVSSTESVGVSGIFTIFDAAGNFVTEAGVGESEPLMNFVIPIEASGNYSTGLALFNPNGNSDLLAILKDTNGTEVARTTKSLASGAHMAFFATGAGQLFPNIISDLRGTLTIQSSAAISALVLRQNSSPYGLTSLPVVSTSSSQITMSLPQVANGSYGGGSYRTSFLLFSTSPNTANVTLTLTKDDGTPFPVTIPGQGTNSTFTFSIAPGRSLFLQTDGSGSLAAGAARITSDVPIGAAGIFTVYDADGNFLTEAGVGDSPVLTQFTLPADLTGNFDTGVAFFNPGTSSVTMTLRFMNASGENSSLSPQITIPAKGHNAAFVSQYFPGTSNVQGSLAISATGGIAAVTLRQNSSPYGLTTLPVASGTAPGTAASKTLLPQTQTGVSATIDITINTTLPPGFRLSGTIGGGFALLVTAQSGNNVYRGVVDPLSGRYLVVVPSGTYTVKTMFSPLTGSGNNILVYTYPNPVPVPGDTTLNITLPTPTLFLVSGSVSGMGSVSGSTNPELVVTSNDNSIQSFIPISNGTYQGSIPAGAYNVSFDTSNLPSGTAQTEELSVYNIGTLTVNNDTVANFTLPNLVTLNGAFSGTTPWTSAGGAIAATDTSGPAIDPLAYLFAPRTSSLAFPAVNTGVYQMLLAQNRVYSMNISHTLSGSSPTTPLGTVSFPVAISTVNMAGNNTYNFTIPSLPGQVTVSGRVIDNSGSGVADVTVSAFTQSLTGASNTGFGAGASTDSGGNYSFRILSGTNYQITFTPRNPAP